MRVTAGLDSGPIALAEEVEVDPLDDYASLSEQARGARRRAVGPRLRCPGGGGDRVHRAGRLTRPPMRRRSPRRSGTCGPPGPRRSSSEWCGRSVPHIGAYLELEGGEPSGSARRTERPANGPEAGTIEVRDDRLVLGSADGALAWMSSSRRVESRCSVSRFPARARPSAKGPVASLQSRPCLDTLVRWPNDSTAAWVASGSAGGRRGRPAAPQLPRLRRALAAPGAAPRAGSSASTACVASSSSRSARTAASTGRSAG